MAATRETRYNDLDSTPEEYILRTCVRIIHGNYNAHANDLKLTFEQPAAVVDGSGYQARLIVLPTFGCVLHEPKV